MLDTRSPVVCPDKGNGIEPLEVLAQLWEGRWLILIITICCTVIGGLYSFWRPPLYRAHSLLQLEEKKGNFLGMEGIEGLDVPFNAQTEIQLIKSRRVLGPVVDSLHLDIVVDPEVFPIVGSIMVRRFLGEPGELAEPLWGNRYAWGGEILEVSRMTVPGGYGAYTLIAGPEEDWELMDEDGVVVLRGRVNQFVEDGDYALMVDRLTARPGTHFHIVKRTRIAAIQSLSTGISAKEKGNGSGIIELYYEHGNPETAEKTLAKVGEYYVQQNVERSGAEADKSLQFLKNSLPAVRSDLEAAEQRLNAYQVQKGTVDISAEGAAVLKQLVDLKERISELEFQRAEIEQRFQRTHPRYKSWASQIAQLQARLEQLNQRIIQLPETQQKLVRLHQDVDVGGKIYLQMLSNIQQLDIARAGTVGNVRVVDNAVVNLDQPVKPNRGLIGAISLVVGGVLGAGVVILRALLNRGIKNPSEIEALGMPVCADIPLSATQTEILGGKGKAQKKSPILAITSPSDLTVESIRSLRTSLHFGLINAPNNVLMMSGPSPGVGKTFLSLNLAASTAMAGQKVLLVDGDLRRGEFHHVFRAGNDRGLSDLLVGTSGLEDVIQYSEIEGLHFITRGQVPPNPSELLMGRRFEALMKTVSSRYDLVIIDTPPILSVTDPVIVGKYAGTTILVARFGASQARELELTKRQFEHNGIKVKGVILNAVEKTSNYGCYNYAYEV